MNDEIVAAWTKAWNAIRTLAYVGDDERIYVECCRALDEAAGDLCRETFKPADRETLFEMQKRIRRDCTSDIMEATLKS